MGRESQTPVKDAIDVVEYGLYQKRKKIYTQRIKGFFQSIRTKIITALMCGYFFIPWIKVNDRQAILFDLPSRQFHIFTLTYWPQDFIPLAWLLAILVFGIFLFTTLFGRVWCGYSCPQSAWTLIYTWIEEKIEGTRNQRIQLDKSPISMVKFQKKFAKHMLWILFAVITGFTFVGYFTPIRELAFELFQFKANPWSYFWITFFTAATYLFAGWMREQVCLYMCPYSRLQSVLFDSYTLVVAYDADRGENRGKRNSQTDTAATNLGDCIDCYQCVHVCPAGIDIRDGLQVQCISCGLCVDACNSVMAKMNYAKSLVSYTSESLLAGKKTKVLRPKIVGSAFAMIILIITFSFVSTDRDALALEILKDRKSSYEQTPSGMIENIYSVKIINMDQLDHEFEISVTGLEDITLQGQDRIKVDSDEVSAVSLSVQVPPHSLIAPKNTIKFTVKSLDLDYKVEKMTESTFLGPVAE